MKKFTKIISCLTAAAIICSAGALSACGSNVVSDVVTPEEWQAAFADENFYNVTVNGVYNYVQEDSGKRYDEDGNLSYNGRNYESGDYDYTLKYDLTADEILFGNIYQEILIGNIYDYVNLKGIYQNKYEFADYPENNVDKEETIEATYYEYSLYYEQGFDYAGKRINDGEESEWFIDSWSNIIGAGHPFCYNYDMHVDVEGLWFLYYIVIYLARNQEFEYKDGAYVYSYDNDYKDYLDQSLLELTDEEFALYEFEFTGGTITYSVIIKDGKVYSIKFTHSYTLSYTLNGSSEYYESCSETYEWIFSDYGTTTVTVPDEVTALFE